MSVAGLMPRRIFLFLDDDIERVNNTGHVSEDRQDNIDPEMFSKSLLQENTKRGQEDRDYDADNVHFLHSGGPRLHSLLKYLCRVETRPDFISSVCRGHCLISPRQAAKTLHRAGPVAGQPTNLCCRSRPRVASPSTIHASAPRPRRPAATIQSTSYRHDLYQGVSAQAWLACPTGPARSGDQSGARCRFCKALDLERT